MRCLAGRGEGAGSVRWRGRRPHAAWTPPPVVAAAAKKRLEELEKKRQLRMEGKETGSSGEEEEEEEEESEEESGEESEEEGESESESEAASGSEQSKEGEGEEAVRRGRRSRKKGHAAKGADPERGEEEMPYVIECPSSFEALSDLVAQWGSRLRTLLDRILTCTSVHLAAENRGKLEKLLELLLRYLAAMGALQPYDVDMGDAVATGAPPRGVSQAGRCWLGPADPPPPSLSGALSSFPPCHATAAAQPASALRTSFRAPRSRASDARSSA